MNSKKLYDKLETMQDMEILTCISASIEYLINVYDFSFNKIIKHLKKAHNYLESVKEN